MPNNDVDYLIIGAGIIGLSLAKTLRQKDPSCKIVIVEKEPHVAEHASGRNSGVLHAGFYYSADTLKAKLSIAGNKALRDYCKTRNLPLKETGKLVVATSEKEVEQLYELEKRGKSNGSQVEIISEEQARKIEPNIKTCGQALWSPLTATVDPKAICNSLHKELAADGVKFLFNQTFQKCQNNLVKTSQNYYWANHIINCAGLYADKIAQGFGFGTNYTIIPFKGLYLKYVKNSTDIRTNIYPVPDLKQTFLGVHFTKTVNDIIKIGPTAIPAFWRENYNFHQRFKLDEFLTILFYEAKLFINNSFGFRSLAFEEMKKYSKSYLIRLSSKLAQNVDPDGFGEFAPPGIRAQLINKQTLQLVMDFMIEGDERSTHILNAISPGFTCSLPFAEYVVDNYILERSASKKEVVVM